MSERYAVGIDIGGTKMAFALVDEQGKIHAEHRLPTNAENGVEAVITALAQGVRTLSQHVPIEGIGIGVPGYVNPTNGVVLEAVNLGWHNIPLADLLAAELKTVPVCVQKDVNAAVMGELRFGAAKSYQNVVLIAIGTGLGIGILNNGQPVTGLDGAAGELGHAGINPNGRLCRCGLRGCPEAYISGVGLLNGLAEHVTTDHLLARPDVTTQHILDAWQQGDSLAKVVMDEAFEQLAQVATICVGLLNPQLIIIGGGLGLALAEPLLSYLPDQIKRRTHAAAHRHLQVVRSQVASSAVGAAALILGD